MEKQPNLVKIFKPDNPGYSYDDDLDISIRPFQGRELAGFRP